MVIYMSAIVKLTVTAFKVVLFSQVCNFDSEAL